MLCYKLYSELMENNSYFIFIVYLKLLILLFILLSRIYPYIYFLNMQNSEYQRSIQLFLHYFKLFQERAQKYIEKYP